MDVKTKALIAGTAGVGLLLYGLRGHRSKPSRRFQATLGSKLPPPANVRGAVVCPLELKHIPADLSGARPGDFVALRVADHAGTFTELIWGIIESIHGTGAAAKLPGGSASTAMTVKLTGSVGSMSVSAPNTAMHGFDLGSRLLLENTCAWEHFRTTAKGMALCGLFGQEVAGKAAPAAASTVGPGEDVLLYVAPVKPGTSLTPGPGWDVPNAVWARITRVSTSGSVLTVALLEDPQSAPGLMLAQGDTLDISRDCVFDVRPGGS